jgi:SAM-dependent methyltransferase
MASRAPARPSSECACGASKARRILQADRYCRYGHEFAEREYSLLRCSDCGLVRTDPAPDEGTHELFEDATFIETYLEREPLFEKFLRPVVEEAQRFTAPASRLIDVGANVGTLVRLASQAGFDASGFETNEAAVEFAQSRGIDVRGQVIEEAGLAAGSVDVVTMSAVAEHLHHLDQTFAQCREILRPGGVLIAANSPNIRSLAWLLEKQGWYGLQPQGHPWQFTPSTITESLERSGFRPLSRFAFGMHRDFGRNRKQRLKKAALALASAAGWGDAFMVISIRV